MQEPLENTAKSPGMTEAVPNTYLRFFCRPANCSRKLLAGN